MSTEQGSAQAPTVFVSYSHDSREHADRVLALADRLVQEGIDVILDQYETSPPEGWPRWMDRHICSADSVLMVCTETYFRRVMGEEEPGKGLGVRWEGNLIYQHLYNQDANTRFVPILFADGQVAHIPTPLQSATYYRVDTANGYEDLYRRLTNQPRVTKPELGKRRALPPRKRQQDFFAPKVSLAKLPSTHPDLFGREKELAALDAAWENGRIHVLSLVAWGGVGKTALVNKWLSQMERDHYRGAERVFGWSFYSQGAAEGRQVSADPFIAAALAWFGDPDPTQGSPWDKGQRLAELVKAQRTLLILDGLEPLQNPPPVETGRIKDPALCCLLRELARQNPGLLVITTRLAVDDLKDSLRTSAMQMDLEDLSSAAGAAYLEHLGVKGSHDELEHAAAEFGGHALALTLLGTYLATVHHGDVRQRDKIKRLTDERGQGPHARRMLESYERWFADTPELDILRLMGLFDRPAAAGALEVLRKEPAMEGLTERVVGQSHADWQYALQSLRAARLLAAADAQEPDTLDCHPLLREHLGAQVRTGHPEAWRAAHSRLYEYYQSSAKEYPETLEEMAPLYAAVAHGCQAGRHQEALDDVFWRRIGRGNESFSMDQLGAFGADLAALSGFFDPPWRTPVAGLRESSQSFVLGDAGFGLLAVGRLAEAAQPMQAGLEMKLAQKSWKNASRAARNLSALYLTLGDVTRALAYAEQSVELADRSKDAFERMARRTSLADAQHQAGRVAEAATLFREAEEMQKARQPELPLLYSVQGFQYNDLLLSQGEWQQVLERAGQTLEWAGRATGVSLLDIAVDHLSLGRAHLRQAQSTGAGDTSPAAAHLEQAVQRLRQAGQQWVLPRGLLSRAELDRVRGALDAARRDLEEALDIATRGGMRLHQADCHLEYTRLHLAGGDKAAARASLARAKEIVTQTGYHRRDAEVQELEAQVGA
jgi:tetratricopeptide (TPR) repeat protein